MSDTPLPPITAGIAPERFADKFAFTDSKCALLVFLFLLTVIGFALRTYELGRESLSEDELNKLRTVEEYRTNGLSGRNGEHPFLMKGLQTISTIGFENWNVAVGPALKVSEEAALRFPTALFGSLTIIVLFVLLRELFGTSIGLIAAGLYAVDPAAIGFDRIAKEDSFLLFFFLLGNFFWVRSQSVADRSEANWFRYCLFAAIAFGAMFASKYLPHILAVGVAYHTVLAFPVRKWRLGPRRWLIFLAVIGISFAVFNPTILIPQTWREILTFSTEKRIGHDAYEFMGELYRNQMTLWLAGVPWTFYYVFIVVKTPLITLALFLIGLPLMLKRWLGDGRFFMFFWALMWFMPFTFLGGKFTRYFTVAEPIVLIVAAVGFYFLTRWLTEKLLSATQLRCAIQTVLVVALISSSLFSSLSVAPYYRLHTNLMSGEPQAAGSYFPHDEFYDTSTRDIVERIAANARPNARIACETPYLFEHYARKIGRDDLIVISLSDKSKVTELEAGDFVAAARGRRYFSNSQYLSYLDSGLVPSAETMAGGVISARIYILDTASAEGLRELAR